MSALPTIITAAGLQPQSPADLRAELIAIAVGEDPGLTTNLPGSLIEDITSTDVGALVVIDTARVDLVNSLTPYGANDPLLIQLGNVYGVAQGVGSNGSVFVVFTCNVAGFTIGQGFTVSDGTNQYVVQDGGTIGSGLSSPSLFALASLPGIFPIPENTVNTLITSVPDGIALTVTNPQAGVPASGPQDIADYRAQVLQAGLASSTGMTRYLKTLLNNVVGVQPRLVSARLVTRFGTTRWEIIVGGGDPYEVAGAIFDAVFDVPSLVGSQITVTNITQANPGVVTTDLNHGLATGQTNVLINFVVGMTGANGGPYTATVIDEKTFSFGVDTTGFGAYVSGGVVTPNTRNIRVSINDYPDVYTIPYVNPPQQTVEITLVWNTTAINFVSDAAVAQLGAQALADYVNSIPVGQPINLFEMQAAFQMAIVGVIPTPLLSRMVFTVSINGVGVSADAGTGLFDSDPESYLEMTPANVNITRG